MSTRNLRVARMLVAAALAGGVVACDRPPEQTPIAPELIAPREVEPPAQLDPDDALREDDLVRPSPDEAPLPDEPIEPIEPIEPRTEVPLENAPRETIEPRVPAPRVRIAPPAATERAIRADEEQTRRGAEAVSQDRPGSMFPGEAPIPTGEPADDVSRRAREEGPMGPASARDLGATIREATRPSAPERPRDAPVVTPAPTSPVTTPSPTSPLPPFF